MNRCYTCGWDNQAGTAKCIKCNNPLDGSSTPRNQQSRKMDDNNQFGGTIPENGQPPLESKKVFSSTIKENPSDQEKEFGETTKEAENMELISCPDESCRYPNPSDATTCIRCNTKLSGEAPKKEEPKVKIEEVDVNKVEEPILQEKEFETLPLNVNTNFSGHVDTTHWAQTIDDAIDPYIASKEQNPLPRCFLTPVLRDDEDYYEFINDNGGKLTKEFKLENSAIELNRDNLDKNNFSITSKVQAKLFLNEGQWYIKDKSSQQTTFITPLYRTEIKDGDILLFGDRKFIFEFEQIVAEAKPNLKGTIDPYKKKNKVVACFLVKVLMEDEEDVNESETKLKFEFTGSEIKLSRYNLESENKTISNLLQAVLFFGEGKWFIQDKSSFSTTFIHAKTETALMDDYNILIGDRKFRFTLTRNYGENRNRFKHT